MCKRKSNVNQCSPLTNKRFGGWSNEGMKPYDENALLVKSDGEPNQQVGHQFKDFMMRKMNGDQINVPKNLFHL